MSGQLDPEIAELLGISDEDEEEVKASVPSESKGKPIAKTPLRTINLVRLINEKSAYSKIVSEAGEKGKRLNELLTHYLKAGNKDEKTMYREKLIPAYWNMLTYLIDDFFEDLTDEKQALFRFGLLNPSFIDEQQKEVLLKINSTVNSAQDVYFIDEWLIMVGNGSIKRSIVDETIKAKKDTRFFMKNKLESKVGVRDAEMANLRRKIEHRSLIEKGLKSSVAILLDNEQEEKLAPYTAKQKKVIGQLQDIIRKLLKSDKDVESTYKSIKSLEGDIRLLKEKGAEESFEVDTKTVKGEFSTLRQMFKMTAGRQGNHFPFLVKTFMPNSVRNVCTKENIREVVDEIESIDPGVFVKKYKQEEHRVAPYFIIVPSYGDYGICWEPFDKTNRATGKGRIAIPMFPRDLRIAVLAALGDMRWQIAKEKAFHRWMEEGLTGYYYDYAQKNKLKGDLKDIFTQDYILWIQFESQGVQKLSREVRSIFWRHLPFAQERKEMLKNRGYYYAELYKKDKNRSMSRGY